MRPETSKSKRGYVYILQSARCDCIKIGGTDYPPLKRIKEINATEPYKSFGIWTLADFRQVEDWRAAEHSLHYRFRSALIAYWYEALVRKAEEGKMSGYERFHNYNAVVRIMESLRG